MADIHVTLIGHVFVDVTLPAGDNPIKLRGGGIMHAARALWALDCPYSLIYCAPDYLGEEVSQHVKEYAALGAYKFGHVAGCPNVMLIAEPKETGPQGYEYLLRDNQTCLLDAKELANALALTEPTDVLIFPGGFDLTTTLTEIGKTKSAVHVDANFEPRTPDQFSALGRSFETLILSTSSGTFLDVYKGDCHAVCRAWLGKFGNSLLLKENRGGSRYFQSSADPIAVPAQPRQVQHSVGVGDCFDAALVVLKHSVSTDAALAYASCIAAEYACTTYPEVFRDGVKRWLAVPADEITEIAGTQLPWENRSSINIYIAAPDFEHVDRRPIDAVAKALDYHNFKPRLPVREHGQMGKGAGKERRQSLCEADLRLLDECQLMLAVLLYNDPGTLIEIGIAVERGMPVLVYDPYGQADNLMLTQLPQLVSVDLDAVITAIFEQASKL